MKIILPLGASDLLAVPAWFIGDIEEQDVTTYSVISEGEAVISVGNLRDFERALRRFRVHI